MPLEAAKAVKKEEAEEDNKSFSYFVRKKPTNANNGGSRKLKKEEKNDDDNKPIKSSSSGSRQNPVKKKEIDEDDDEKPGSSGGVSKGLGGQSQTTAGRRVKLTMDFISNLKEAFHDEPAKYKGFVKVLVDFKALRLDKASTLAKLVELMKDHGDLLRAFSVLFPEANITVPPEDKQQIAPDDHKRKRADQSDGADFMNKRKTRSQSRRDTDAAQQVY